MAGRWASMVSVDVPVLRVMMGALGGTISASEVNSMVLTSEAIQSSVSLSFTRVFTLKVMGKLPDTETTHGFLMGSRPLTHSTSVVGSLGVLPPVA